jgi:competence protein ComEA
MTEKPRECEPQEPFFSGWRKVVLWLVGAAALAVVGYRGALGTEMAAAAPPPILAETRPDTAPSAAATSAPTPHAPTPPGGRLPAATAPEPAGTATTRAAPTGSHAPAANSAPAASAGDHIGAAPAAAAITPDGKIVLNLATEAELRKLPGIGKARARAILEQRERVGRFRRLEDLLRVKGIGPKRLAALRARLVLDAP